MNELINEKKTKDICSATAICFAAIHSALLAIFAANRVTPMAIFNIISVLTYLLCLWVIHIGKARFFVAFAFAEVLLHMSLAVWFVGWDSGFQIALITINLMVFFGVYIGKVLGMAYYPSVPLSLLCMLTYLALLIISRYHEPPYPLPENVAFWLQLCWSFAVFSITIVSMQSFIWLAFHSEKRLSTQVDTDRLTGLGSRAFLSSRLNRLEKERQLEGRWIAIADIDDFKKINDSYGHLAGDYVLETLGDLMRGCSVEAEIGRWGGEEFLILGSVGDGMEIHLARLERLRRTAESHAFRYEGTPLHLTVTIGAAVYQSGQSLEQWIDAADQKLYEGKSSGKNRVVS